MVEIKYRRMRNPHFSNEGCERFGAFLPTENVLVSLKARSIHAEDLNYTGTNKVITEVNAISP